MKIKQTVIGSMLLAAAMGSSALSIGRVRGAAWIGQALDVAVPVRLEAGEDGSSLCFEADVFHADTRIDPRYVRVQAESAPNTSEAREVLVRVRASTIVDEPVVTVYLKVGCDQKITRRLVLLAELPTETSSAIAAAPLPVMPVPSLVAPAPAAGMPSPPIARAPAPAGATRAPATALPSATAPVARAPRPPRPAAPAPAPSTAAAAAPMVPPDVAAATATAPKASARPAEAPKAAAAAAPRSRLKLDPAELPPERDSTLRTTGMLAGTPEENEQKRADAAALWRSINAQPEDVLRDTQRLQSLESSINALRSQMMQNQTNISDLKNQLEQAQTERYANPLVYALVALLLAALGGMAWMWQRGRRGGAARNADWWRDVDHRSPVTVQVPHGPVPGAAEAPPTVKTRARSAPPPAAAPQVEELDLDLGIEDLPPLPVQPSAPFQAAHLPPRRTQNTDFASSFGGSGRSVNTEELFDIHQQADFFLSLGQHDQAIGVLLAHIRDNPETSALAYLDLFKIYHQQNRREPYDKLRAEFSGAFSADVPEFDAFNETGRGLAAYEDTLARIVELWGSPDVITLIEELIFRRPNGDEVQTFDLEAYKELLLLFAVALEVSNSEEDSFVMSGPDSAYAEFGGAPPTLPPLAEPPPRDVQVSLPPLDLSVESVPPPVSEVDIDLMLTESMVAPLDSLPKPKAPESSTAIDANGIEFELFDPSTEAQIKPKRDKT